MQARYPGAIAEVSDHARIAAGAQERPGNQRRHVFDFPDGLRAIVSRDRLTDGREGTFISGSFIPNSRIYERLAVAPDPPNELCRVIQARWQQLAGSNRTPELFGWSSGKGDAASCCMGGGVMFPNRVNGRRIGRPYSGAAFVASFLRWHRSTHRPKVDVTPQELMRATLSRRLWRCISSWPMDRLGRPGSERRFRL